MDYLKSSPCSVNGIGLPSPGVDLLHPTVGYPGATYLVMKAQGLLGIRMGLLMVIGAALLIQYTVEAGRMKKIILGTLLVKALKPRFVPIPIPIPFKLKINKDQFKFKTLQIPDLMSLFNKGGNGGGGGGKGGGGSEWM